MQTDTAEGMPDTNLSSRNVIASLPSKSAPTNPSAPLFRFRRNRLCGLLFLFPIADRRPDGIFCQNRAVDLYWRKRELLHDVHILDRESLVHGLALDPFGGQR